MAPSLAMVDRYQTPSTTTGEIDRHRPGISAEKYKTKMCRQWLEKGTCPYESKCMFAHGPDQLRSGEEIPVPCQRSVQRLAGVPIILPAGAESIVDFHKSTGTRLANPSAPASASSHSSDEGEAPKEAPEDSAPPSPRSGTSSSEYVHSPYELPPEGTQFPQPQPEPEPEVAFWAPELPQVDQEPGPSYPWSGPMPQPFLGEHPPWQGQFHQCHPHAHPHPHHQQPYVPPCTCHHHLPPCQQPPPPCCGHCGQPGLVYPPTHANSFYPHSHQGAPPASYQWNYYPSVPQPSPSGPWIEPHMAGGNSQPPQPPNAPPAPAPQAPEAGEAESDPARPDSPPADSSKVDEEKKMSE